jgi:hypothetical protein
LIDVEAATVRPRQVYVLNEPICLESTPRRTVKIL